MRVHICSEGLGVGAHVFLSPEVADFLGALLPEVGPGDSDFVGLVSPVEESDGQGTVFHGFIPDFSATAGVESPMAIEANARVRMVVFIVNVDLLQRPG